MKENRQTLLIAGAFLIGIVLLFFPIGSQLWDIFGQLRTITSYQQQVSQLTDAEYDEVWERAVDYNERIPSRSDPIQLSRQEIREYQEILNVNKDGIMGYLKIPTINVTLPIYHGTKEHMMDIGVAHLEWSALPVGGAGAHCVLSGQRGLPNAALLSNIDKMKEGDVFTLQILNEALLYEVSSVSIAGQDELETLMPEKDRDLCTIVSCTAYGPQSYRFFVRGRRTKREDVSSDAPSHRK